MEPARYEIRAVLPSDEDGLLELSRHLDTVNLPHDRDGVREIIEHSVQSFEERITDPRRRQWVFVLRDRVRERVIGSSLVVGQLGRRDAPYIYLDVLTDEKYSSTLDRHFAHPVLRVGYSYDGPTEIGGLVMHPDYRQAPERLGTMISYVRFLFIAIYRDLMRSEILAELLPPLEPDGTSHLWEALGRKFTGLTYSEADRLSKRNKEFVRSLWPEAAIYASLLPAEAQSVIGKVGPQTRGVEKLLRRIGFDYAYRIDPFDGGPHFVAPTDRITLVQQSRALRLRAILGSLDESPVPDRPRRHLVVNEYDVPPYLRAMSVMSVVSDEGIWLLASDSEALEAKLGETLWALPLD